MDKGFKGLYRRKYLMGMYEGKYFTGVRSNDSVLDGGKLSFGEVWGGGGIIQEG